MRGTRQLVLEQDKKQGDKSTHSSLDALQFSIWELTC